MTNYTSMEILNQLDTCCANYTFPMLDNGYLYPAATKLSAYRNNEQWVLIIEVLGFNDRQDGHEGISNCLYVFGNCLNYKPGTFEENFLQPTNDDEKDTFKDDNNLDPTCKTFLLRDQVTEVIHNREVYENEGIALDHKKKIHAFEFLRLLAKYYQTKLFATENEIKERIPKNIPKIMELYDWFHPNVVRGELPSQNETFVQIAKVLETGNIKFYSPTQTPNTHWSNWPDGGQL